MNIDHKLLSDTQPCTDHCRNNFQRWSEETKQKKKVLPLRRNCTTLTIKRGKSLVTAIQTRIERGDERSPHQKVGESFKNKAPNTHTLRKSLRPEEPEEKWENRRSEGDGEVTHCRDNLNLGQPSAPLLSCDLNAPIGALL